MERLYTRGSLWMKKTALFYKVMESWSYRNILRKMEIRLAFGRVRKLILSNIYLQIGLWFELHVRDWGSEQFSALLLEITIIYLTFPFQEGNSVPNHFNTIGGIHLYPTDLHRNFRGLSRKPSFHKPVESEAILRALSHIISKYFKWRLICVFAILRVSRISLTKLNIFFRIKVSSRRVNDV